MKKTMRRCAHCHCLFEVCNKVSKHEYCNKKECQKARKRKWQREKIKNDADYCKDQKEAHQDWKNNNPDYWRTYRSNNKEYADRNRRQQCRRNLARQATSAPVNTSAPIAKMDAILSEKALISGKYQLVPVMPDMIAKMDALIVEIKTIPNNYNFSGL